MANTPGEDERSQVVPYMPRPQFTQSRQELACSTEGQPERIFHPFQRLNKDIALRVVYFPNLCLTSKRIHYRLTPVFWDRLVSYKCPAPIYPEDALTYLVLRASTAGCLRALKYYPSREAPCNAVDWTARRWSVPQNAVVAEDPLVLALVRAGPDVVYAPGDGFTAEKRKDQIIDLLVTTLTRWKKSVDILTAYNETALNCAAATDMPTLSDNCLRWVPIRKRRTTSI